MRKPVLIEWIEMIAWIIFIIFIVALWLSSTGCKFFNPDLPKEGKTWADGAVGGKPAKNKPVFVSRGDWMTEGDFQKALSRKIAWLESTGHEVFMTLPVHGRDMTQRLVIRYYIIYYREVKKK